MGLMEKTYKITNYGKEAFETTIEQMKLLGWEVVKDSDGKEDIGQSFSGCIKWVSLRNKQFGVYMEFGYNEYINGGI